MTETDEEVRLRSDQSGATQRLTRAQEDQTTGLKEADASCQARKTNDLQQRRDESARRCTLRTVTVGGYSFDLTEPFQGFIEAAPAPRLRETGPEPCRRPRSCRP